MRIIGRRGLFNRLGSRGLQRSPFESVEELNGKTPSISIYKTPRPVIIIRAEDADAAGVHMLPHPGKPIKRRPSPFPHA